MPQRAVQNVLRFCIYFKRWEAPQASYRTTKLLLLVFGISTLRKLRAMSELLAPLARGKQFEQLSKLAGASDFSPVAATMPAADVPTTSAYVPHVGSKRWLWATKYEAVATDHDLPTPSMERESHHEQLRHQLEGLETTLALLDTVADGIALFARLGLTVTLPVRLVDRVLSQKVWSGSLGTSRPWHALRHVFHRFETYADIFWLSSTLCSLALAEWERSEVWQYGRTIRRSMRDDELARDVPNLSPDVEAVDNNDARSDRIRQQRRILKNLRGRLTWLWWERFRLIADAVFATYDVFEFSSGSEPVRAIAGLASASIGFVQVSPCCLCLPDLLTCSCVPVQVWSESLRVAQYAVQ